MASKAEKFGYPLFIAASSIGMMAMYQSAANSSAEQDAKGAGFCRNGSLENAVIDRSMKDCLIVQGINEDTVAEAMPIGEPMARIDEFIKQRNKDAQSPIFTATDISGALGIGAGMSVLVHGLYPFNRYKPQSAE